MKFQSLALCLMATCLLACKSKQVVEEHPPGMDKLRPKITVELPKEFIGEWERCEVRGNISVYTKAIISNSLEIKETVFKDEHCQLIESTRDRSMISFYFFEYAQSELKAKIQSRKLVLFDRKEVERMNAEGTCGSDEWKVKRPKEVLGISCPGLPRDNKHDLSRWDLQQLAIDKISFAGKEMTRVKDNNEVREIKLINNTNSEVLPEPGSKNVMLVFPPRQEVLRVELPLLPHANLKGCSSVLNTFQSSLNAQEKIKGIKSEVESQKTTLVRIKEEINQAITELMDYVEANGLSEYDALIKEVEQLDESISSLEMDYRGCETDCDSISTQLKDLRNKRWETNNKISTLRISRQLVRGYNSHLIAIERIEQRQEKQKEVVSAKEKQLREAEDKLLTLFDDFDRKEGVPATMRFEGQWGANLAALINANPGLKFRYANIEGLVMTYRLLGLNNYPAHTSILSFPEVEATSLVKGRINLKAYPFSMNGASNLSLIGACPAHDPESFGIKLKGPRVLEFEVNFTY